MSLGEKIKITRDRREQKRAMGQRGLERDSMALVNRRQVRVKQEKIS